jgi:signal transduction histidine kinase
MQIQHSDFQDQMVRGLTHRMNNILTVFNGHLGLLLLDESLEPATRQALQKIVDGTAAAAELMDRTHSLVRPTRLVCREIDLGEFVSGMRADFEEFRGPKQLLELETPEGMPRVWGDLGRIKNTILELVRNAFEAAPEEGVVKITLQVELPFGASSPALQPLTWISLRVSDNGPGVDPEAEEKMFAPFYTEKKSRNAAGLGLTVALSSIHQLGGALRYRRESPWTHFELVLPSRSRMGSAHSLEGRS